MAVTQAAIGADITNQFFFDETVAVSLVERAAANDIENLEWVIFNTSITFNFGGIDDDGNLKIGIDKNGGALTALDAQMMSNAVLREHDNTIVIDAVNRFFVQVALENRPHWYIG